MSKNKLTGLGRGLDALINPIQNEEKKQIDINDTELKSDDGASVDILAKIDIFNVLPNPYQPRSEFEPNALDELKRSILNNGLIQPITVRRKTNDQYELISGERRLRACKEVGYKTIPAYIIQVDSKEAMVALALIENIQREKLNAIEVAKAYKQLIEECNLSQEQVAEKVGKDRSTITNSIRLLKLPVEVQNSLVKNEITAGHARALINLYDQHLQISILNKIKKNNLSVRKVEMLVKEITEGKRTAGNKKPKQSNRELISQLDIENKLRNVFGTKVTCKQKKDGAGEITISFFSNDELERLFELFELLENAD